MLTPLTHWLRLFVIALGLLACFSCVKSARADLPPSSILYTEVYRDTIRNDPDFGPGVIPIVSSSLSVSLYTNVPAGTFTKKTPWDISFGQVEVSGTFSNAVNYTAGDSSVAIPFIDPNTSQVAGSIHMSWQSGHFVMTITTSSDFVDAVDFYTGSTGPISDSYDLTISVGKFTNTATVYLTGFNTHRTDPATQLDLDTGNITGKGDFVPPTVTIQSPAQNFTSGNSALTVTGFATDNIGIGSVLWRWAAPGEDPSRGAARFDWNAVDNLNVPQSGFATHATWNTAVDMSDNGPGTNRLWVTSQDLAGHYSPIQTRQLFYSVPSQLSLSSTDGGHAVGGSGVADGAMLIIDRWYTVNAVPSSRDYIFLNWSDGAGTVYSISPRYTFLMQDSLTLQANFGANPFPAVAGTYTGLFNPSNGVSELDSGLITVTIDSRGLYSGKVCLESGTYSFSGQFGFYGNDSDRNAADGTFQIPIVGAKPIIGSLHIAGAGTDTLSRNLSGHLSIYDARLQHRVVSVIDAGYSTGTNGDVAAGTYNFLLPSAQGTTQIGPLGNGFGTLTLRSNATATSVITLADQTPVATCSSALVEGGSLPVFTSAYAGKGILIGWLTFTNDATADLRGSNLHWIKRRQKTAYYADGFTRVFDVVGSRYVAPKTGTNILGWTTGTVSYADFAFSGTSAVTFDPTVNKLGFPANPDNLHISFSPVTGQFSGSLATQPVLPVRGVVLPKAHAAYGFFLDQNQSGFVIFSTP